MPTYGRTAVNCPAPQVYSTPIQPANATPTTQQALTAGDTMALLTKFNTNAASIDALGQLGAGAYAVRQGTGELTAGTGLTLNVSAVAAVMDGPVSVPAQTLALTDASDNHIWLLRTGAVTKQTGSLLPPTGGLVYLGTVTTAAGAITVIDYSGRLEFRGGSLYRRTADAGAPTDTPPASLMFLNRTAGGRYWWDGGAYSLMASGATGAAGGVLSGTYPTPGFAVDMATQAELDAVAASISATAPSYGELYEDTPGGTTLNLATGATYYGWVSAAAGLVAGAGYVTADTSQASGDRLVIGASGAGRYRVQASVSLAAALDAQLIMTVRKNGTEQGNLKARRDSSSENGLVRHLGVSGFVDLVASDYVDLAFKWNASGNVTLYAVNLTIERVA